MGIISKNDFWGFEMKKRNGFVLLGLSSLLAISAVTSNAAVDPGAAVKKEITTIKKQIQTITSLNTKLTSDNKLLLSSTNSLKSQISSMDIEIAGLKEKVDGTKKEVSTRGTLKELPAVTLSTIKDTIITLPFNSNNEKIQGVYITSGDQVLNGDIGLDGYTLTIKPLANIQLNTSYSVQLVAANDLTYTIPATTPKYEELNVGTEQIIRMPANPAKGFNYPYYIWVPASMTAGKFMMVETSNTLLTSGTKMDELKVRNSQLKWQTGGQVAQKLEVPMMMPVFPRPIQTRYSMYTHDLDRETLLETTGELARIDLQLKAMIKDAQDMFKFNDVAVRTKVYMSGFSASGRFANKFVALHPELIQAAAFGGVNSCPILPLSKWKGKTLRYPVGVADFKELTGSVFNYEAYRKVPQFMFMGINDDNDITLFGDGYDIEDRDLTWDVLGRDMAVRWTNVQSAYKEANVNTQIHTYLGTGHSLSDVIFNDMANFFRANSSETFHPIQASAYGY
jgi:hypothetical protein